MIKLGIVNSASFGKLFDEQLERLKKISLVEYVSITSGSEVEIINKLANFDAIIASTTPYYTASILRNLKNLKLIARHGTGCNNIDVETANKLGIYLTRTPGTYAANAVAEYTLGLILNVLRNIALGVDFVKTNRWKERGKLVGTDLQGKTIGIIGYGNIAKKLAKLLSVFDVNILIYDTKTVATDLKNIKQTELDEILSSADIISLHCSVNNDTTNIINSNSLKLFKPGAILINTARGELVDHISVAEALENDLLGYYVTDVVSDEPINNKHILLNVKNCQVLPHLGGYSKGFLKEMGETCVSSVEAIALNLLPDQRYLSANSN